MGKYNNHNINYSQQTDHISNYSVHPFMKHFISGYFIFDIVFMLYSDRSSKEFCIYFFLLVGGTALDLIILNDFYLFNGHNSSLKAAYDFIDQNTSMRDKEILGLSMGGVSGRNYGSSGNNNYSSQLGSGIAVGQFLDTCFLTILVTYRIFRIYSVAKKWYPKFKQTYRVLSKDNSIQFSQKTSTGSSYDETEITSPEITANSSITLTSQNTVSNNGTNPAILQNTLQVPLTEINGKEETSETLSTGNTNEVTNSKKSQDSQLNDINLTTQSQKYNNIQQSSQQVAAQTPQSAFIQQNQIRSSATNKQKIKSAIPVINQDVSGYQSQNININLGDNISSLSQTKLKKKVENSESSISQNSDAYTQKESIKSNDNNSLNIVKIDNHDSLNSEQSRTIDESEESQQLQSNRIKQKANRNQVKKQQEKSLQQSKPSTSPTKTILENNNGRNNNQHKNNNGLLTIPNTPNQYEIGNTQYHTKFQSNLGNRTFEQKTTASGRAPTKIEDKVDDSSSITRNGKDIQKKLSPIPKNIVNSSNDTQGGLAKSTKVNQIAQQSSKKQQVYVQKKPVHQSSQQLKGYQIITTSVQNVQNNSAAQKTVQNFKESQWQQDDDAQSTAITNTINSDNKIPASLVEQNCEDNKNSNTLQIEEQNSKTIKKTLDCQEQNSVINKNNNSSKVNNNDIKSYNQNKIEQNPDLITLLRTEQEEEEKEINLLPASPSSANESNGENTSRTSSPLHSSTHNHQLINQNFNALIVPPVLLKNTEGLVSASKQTKSNSKFSYEQDYESSSEDNNDRDSQHVYKEDSHFDKPSTSKSPCFIVGSSQSSQQSLQNSQRKLTDTKNRSNRKSITSKQSNKTPIESPSNNLLRCAYSPSSVNKERKITIQEEDYETVISTLPQETIEQRSNRGDTLAHLQAEPSSFKLDPTNSTSLPKQEQDNKGQTTANRQKDSWESVTDIMKDEGHEQDPNKIDYFANPLLEILSLPYRSPNIHAVSPTMGEKRNIVTTFNGFMFQQIGNWNESLQLSQHNTPEINQTTSNTLSPKHPKQYHGLSDNPNDKAKKRKSTNVNSEDLVSDQDKQNFPPAWRIISGEDENSSYEEYQQDFQDQNEQDSNNEQNPESKSQQYLQKKQIYSTSGVEGKEQLFKPLFNKSDLQNKNYLQAPLLMHKSSINSLNQQIQYDPKGLKLELNSLQDGQQVYYPEENIYSNQQLPIDFNTSILKSEKYLCEQEQTMEGKQQDIFDEPLIVEVKGENGLTFEVTIKELSDFEGYFDEECQKNNLNIEDILAAKTTILASLIEQSLMKQNSQQLHDLTMLLNEITLEYTLKIYEDMLSPKSQQSFIKLIRDDAIQESEFDSYNNEGYYGQQQKNYQYYSNYYENNEANYLYSPNRWNQPPSMMVNNNAFSLTSPLQMNRFSQNRYYDEGEQQINLSEFNVHKQEYMDTYGEGNPLINNLQHRLFSNLNFSKNPSTIQSIGNISPLGPPPPGILGIGKQISLQPTLNGPQRANGQPLNGIQAFSVADIDTLCYEERLEQQQQLFNLLQYQTHFKSEMQLSSPPTKQFLFKGIQKPIPQYGGIRNGSQQQFGFIHPSGQQSTNGIPHSLSSNPNIIPKSSTPNQIQSTHNFTNITSTDKFSSAMSSSTKKVNPANSISNNIYDQWKFNPSSLTSTPLQQPQQPSSSNIESNPGSSGAGRGGQRMWMNSQPQTPYLLETPTPNLLSKPQPQINTTNNLFSQDLLSQLAQLGQPVK